MHACMYVCISKDVSRYGIFKHHLFLIDVCSVDILVAWDKHSFHKGYFRETHLWEQFGRATNCSHNVPPNFKRIKLLSHLATSQKVRFRSLPCIRKSLTATLGLEKGCVNLMGAWDFLALSAGNLHVHKIPRFRGSLLFFFFFGGGGGLPIYFIWARGFSWKCKLYCSSRAFVKAYFWGSEMLLN